MKFLQTAQEHKELQSYLPISLTQDVCAPIMSSADVALQIVPCINFFFSLDRPIVAIVRPHDYNSNILQEGDNHTITCEVLDSKPRANYIEWIHDGELVPISSRYQLSGITPVVNLTIYQVTRWVQCCMSNSIK